MSSRSDPVLGSCASAAALVAGVVGIVFGLPSLRIKGFYLIMATVAAYFIIHWLVLQFRGLTNGTDGCS